MTPLPFNSNEIDSECGAYIPMTAFISILLLAIIGLVIDTGTLARSRMQLQKSADAAVIAGLDYRIHVGRGDTPTDIPVRKDEIQERARLFARQNLRQLGYNVDSVNVHDVVFDPDLETLTVSITYKVPYLLMPLVPLRMLGALDTADSQWLTVVATARIPRSNILIVADTSNSMSCPWNDPDCSCADPNMNGGTTCDLSPTSGANGNGRAKIYDLRRGIYSFLDNFQPGKDRIGLVSFDMVAKTLVELRAPGFLRDEFNDKLGAEGTAIPADFAPGGLTNPSDGLMTAYEEVRRFSQANPNLAIMGANDSLNEPFAVVFFTDGAPTAKESCYADTKGMPRPADSRPDPQAGDPASQYDTEGFGCPATGSRYVDIELEWVYPAGTQPAWASSNRVRGPSPLMKKAALLQIPKVQRVPSTAFFDQLRLITDLQDPTTSIPSCSVGPSSDLAPLPGGSSAALNLSHGSCLNSLQSFLPDGTRTQSGTALANYKTSFYDRAEAVARYLRGRGVLMYALGIGPTSPTSPKTDLYQNSNNDFNRKDGFLVTLANDTDAAKSGLMTQVEQPDGTFVDTYPALNYDEFESWNDRQSDARDGRGKTGVFIGGYSEGGVTAMFDAVGRDIKLRFVK